jgi:hypothetical protein
MKYDKYKFSTYETMQRICIDTINININRPDINGNQHIIVMIEAFTRWVELTAVPDLTAMSAARALLSFMGRFGVPTELQSDNGTQYLNELLSELSKLVVNIQNSTYQLILKKKTAWLNAQTKKLCVTYDR